MKWKFENWILKTKEIYIFLKSLELNFEEYDKYLPKGIIKRGQAPFLYCDRPKSGDFFIIDTVRCASFKKDKHIYKRNKNNI